MAEQGAGSRDAVLADGAARHDQRVATTYDTVAASYADHLAAELVRKPFDRWLLHRIATDAGDLPVADAGCGPGHVTRFLTDAGARAVGFDLSEGMVEHARHLFPDLVFEQGDLMRPPRTPGGQGWGAVIAWYSLVHLAGSELASAVAALAGVLAPGGRLGVAVHVGSEVLRREEWWGHEIEVDFVQHDADQVRDAFDDAGLADVEWYLRGPYAGAEVATERLYVVGTKQ